MHYSELTEVYDDLEKHPSKLKKTEIVAKILRKADKEDLQRAVLLLTGRVFPRWDEREIGVAGQLMIKAAAKSTGQSAKNINENFKKTGDLGETAEHFIKGKRQTTLGTRVLTVEKVFENIRKISGQEGKGSQERKLDLIAELLVSAKPKEAKYIVRTVLEELRVGVAEGILRDAIMEAFLLKDNIGARTKDKMQQAQSAQKLKEKDKELIQERKRLGKIVEGAWFLNQDYGEIAKIAKEKGVKGLEKVEIEIGKPIAVLLGEKAPDLKTAMDKFKECAIEQKYDGMRCQIHKQKDDIWLYTRRQENVTNAFPDLVRLCRKAIKANNCIIEGECLAIDPKTKRPMPFQRLSQRIKRKYDIEEILKDIPIQLNVFDLVYLNGKLVIEKPFKERRKLLEKIIKEISGKFQLAEQLTAKDLEKAEKFYKRALNEGQEGVMVKNLNAKYVFGRRVEAGWLKVKPIMETLDLAIIGGVWGTGKRAGWIGSFILGCRDSESGEFLECGMIGSGMKEKKTEPEDITLDELTKILKPLIICERDNKIKIKPKILIEVAYEEIQKSPTYNSGWALRFPRVIGVRYDKKIDETDSLERIRKLYGMQKGKK